MKTIFSFTFLFFLTNGFSQEKKLIDHTSYDLWKSIQNTSLSANGKWLSFEITTISGDNSLVVMSTAENGDSANFARGKNATFLPNENCIVFQVSPETEKIRSLTLAKTPKDKMPKDSLFIFWPELDSLIKVPRVKSYKVSKSGDWISYLSFDDNQPKCPEEQTKKQKKKNPCSTIPTSGTTLTLINTTSAKTKEIHFVSDYLLDENGLYLSYVLNIKGAKDTLSVHVLTLADFNDKTLLEKQYGISSLTFDVTSKSLAFIASADTNKRKSYSLYLTDLNLGQCELIVDSTELGMPRGWNVSEFGRVYFSESTQKLYFGTNLLVQQDLEDSLLESEKAKVDVWSGFDLKIQPQQLLEKNKDEKRSYLAVYHLSNKEMIQLGHPEVENVRVNTKSNTNLHLGIDERPYLKETTWAYPWLSDYYLIDSKTGLARY